MTGDSVRLPDATVGAATDVGAGFPRRVVVGVDGTRGSRAALAWTALLAQATGARVLAVHVLTYDRELVRDVTFDTMRTWRRELDHDLRTRWVEPLDGIEHRCLVVESDSPATGLLDAADDERADLVVVGAGGHGALANRVHGGTSYRVSHRARQPAVVVPADWAP